jgi:hypothetical protein
MPRLYAVRPGLNGINLMSPAQGRCIALLREIGARREFAKRAQNAFEARIGNRRSRNYVGRSDSELATKKPRRAVSSFELLLGFNGPPGPEHISRPHFYRVLVRAFQVARSR